MQSQGKYEEAANYYTASFSCKPTFEVLLALSQLYRDHTRDLAVATLNSDSIQAFRVIEGLWAVYLEMAMNLDSLPQEEIVRLAENTPFLPNGTSNFLTVAILNNL